MGRIDIYPSEFSKTNPQQATQVIRVTNSGLDLTIPSMHRYAASSWGMGFNAALESVGLQKFFMVVHDTPEKMHKNGCNC